MEVKKFVDESENVTKYVFVQDDACYEAVLYRYPTYQERTVLCVSTQCGCPVGCTFCGTGKKFVKNLKSSEIIGQIWHIFDDIGIIEKQVARRWDYGHLNPCRLQVMFMSMGEPFLNYQAVESTIQLLNVHFPQAELLVSSIGPNQQEAFRRFAMLSSQADKVGLQFSIHRSTDEMRNELIPYKNKMRLLEIRNYGVEWYKETGRKVYLNYCVDGTNNWKADFRNLELLFPQNAFAFTFSVVCSADETMKDAGMRNLDKIRAFEKYFVEAGYDTRIFDPAGQDSIGGGCGQLWYVQKWMKEHVQN